MVTVGLTRGPDGQPWKLRVSGHAGQGAYGEDIVCAAVSALVETLSLGLARVVHEPAGGQVEPGNAEFLFHQPMGAETRAVVETILVGLKDLAASEPQAVRYQEQN
ncbi:ribosomal-processing cysteine protease Prp [Sulfobacillus harzensis]|uniref:Ribosomal processing cysteine protease Prp n=1 Tax=Sulfobacillus harzensis TaxID=2729629 RepID=A0A7Y0Q2J6_9FIRM|nr:ribosomal-processing cysteine protease Prp [Sulfobacillus harzensis]NMP21229.1 ribosomal-processing cysteine protease Prp [Sulfobacillus harzensis]